MGCTYTIDGYFVLLGRRDNIYAGNSLWEAFIAYRGARKQNAKYICVTWRP